ncbi:hypothetical protein [Williamsia sp. 1135]|uniref:hypothetical protein n=1 Tax=Williamsia sp. 1135 TaxID=1889262 RepID=UPI000A118879|nr:hypothetical protein [Williamsia sp. 1135]ORM35501.1 hypothetical protein BFL43_09275 [Williamsia sp. 1135]
MPTTSHPNSDEPVIAAVYVELPGDTRTAPQWTSHLTAQLDDGVDLEVVIEPAGNRAAIVLTARGDSGPATLGYTVNRLISDPQSFGLVDAARTQRASD